MHPTDNINNIFQTPLWIIPGEVPSGMYEWCGEYQKNTECVEISNKGGYQSEAKDGLDDIPFEYTDILREKLFFLPSFKFQNWWLNVNYKGNYNIVHTHPLSDLAVIWYMTDNHGLLNIRNPLAHQRWRLLEVLDNYILKDMNVNASAGDIVIFPSDIPHDVNEHMLDEPRICLSFNLKLH